MSQSAGDSLAEAGFRLGHDRLQEVARKDDPQGRVDGDKRVGDVRWWWRDAPSSLETVGRGNYIMRR